MAVVEADGHSADAVTILRARGRRLAKTIHPDGRVDAYDMARKFDLYEKEIADFRSLATLSEWLQDRPDFAIVRGAIADPERVRGVRRLLHRDDETGEEPTIVEVPKRNVTFDWDSVPLDPSISIADLTACGEFLRSTLPPEFHAVAMVITATAGHGLKPGARMRGAALLETPLTSNELTWWMRDAPCDRAAFRPAQIIYTARPVFVGAADPFPRRIVQLSGSERAACPPAEKLAPPLKIRKAVENSVRSAGSNQSSAYVRAALTRAAVAIATAAPGARHPLAVKEAWSLSRFVNEGSVTADQLRDVIEGALRIAGKAPGEGTEIVAWALAHAPTETEQA